MGDCDLDPVALFEQWATDAVTARIAGPNATALATADSDAAPSVRLVILRGFDSRGIVFHTNYNSRKGMEIEANPRASAVMLWHAMGRQVRIEGPVSKISGAESDNYFRSRSRSTQIDLLASAQSRVITHIGEVEGHRLAEHRQWSDREIQRRAYWGGYLVGLQMMEFWENATDGLHARVRFRRETNQWIRERLAP